MKDLKITEIVRLNSGGPKMTVIRFIGEDSSNIQLKMADEYLKLRGFTDGDAICHWFVENNLNEGTFKRESLVKEL